MENIFSKTASPSLSLLIFKFFSETPIQIVSENFILSLGGRCEKKDSGVTNFIFSARINFHHYSGPRRTNQSEHSHSKKFL